MLLVLADLLYLADPPLRFGVPARAVQIYPLGLALRLSQEIAERTGDGYRRIECREVAGLARPPVR